MVFLFTFCSGAHTSLEAFCCSRAEEKKVLLRLKAILCFLLSFPTDTLSTWDQIQSCWLSMYKFVFLLATRIEVAMGGGLFFFYNRLLGKKKAIYRRREEEHIHCEIGLQRGQNRRHLKDFKENLCVAKKKVSTHTHTHTRRPSGRARSGAGLNSILTTCRRQQTFLLLWFRDELQLAAPSPWIWSFEKSCSQEFSSFIGLLCWP